jgi:hypothetical protein
MKCSGSPTTCTASGRALTPATEDAGGVREAAAAFTAFLLRIALKPLAQPLGFYGDVAVDACARAMARSGTASFTGGIAGSLVRSGAASGGSE